MSKAFWDGNTARDMAGRMRAEPGGFTVDGDIHVELRRSAQARRMTLRVARAGGGVVLTLPHSVSLAEGRAFAESRSAWLRQTRAGMPELRILRPGATLPVAGQGLAVTPAATRTVQIREGALLVPLGRPAGPVVAAWLKHRARAALAVACDRYAAMAGRSYAALSLRDTRSRWGSCTHDGRLMFSWRLAMAPPAVLDYVAAHEVAHLRHMDHSAAFWGLTGRLMPGYESHRDWLRRHGAELQAWIFADQGDARPNPALRD
ncbi:SprT family zinc-dependent metalloprotease [Paracoccus sp. DMF-8]|uniref:M48 family metallopeptidase n=1 Tax=Paracoccus sp. DMF-8 TaxID=3019445 RepID=UPI0023E7568F|nr:SprT family zinc-dependent metalloprotease [Paracoccus sp. DMF-8]MDF3605998.1 SprT family zinc-dependent metalloprotease [Paracoccus sp. DMF-8]